MSRTRTRLLVAGLAGVAGTAAALASSWIALSLWQRVRAGGIALLHGAVTGAAGFIGSHLSDALRQAGHAVRMIDCFVDFSDPALEEQNTRGGDVERIVEVARHVFEDGARAQWEWTLESHR